MTTLTATTIGTNREYMHSLDSGVDKRHFAERVVNVKDHGATGDGLTNDTAAIKAAIDAAFGTQPTSNGQGNPFINTELYFPPGHYRVLEPLGLSDIIGVKVYGAGVDATHIHFRAPGNTGNTVTADPDATPLWATDGVAYSLFSDMTWSNDVSVPFVSKVTNAASVLGEDEVYFADTSDIEIGTVISNYSDPRVGSITQSGPGYVIAKTGTSVQLDTTIGANGVASGATIYFTSSTVGFDADQRGSNGICTALTFRNLRVVNFGVGILARGSSANAENFILENVVFEGCSFSGFRVLTFNTLNFSVIGGGAHNCAAATTFTSHYDGGIFPLSGNWGAAYSCPAGSIPTICGVHTSGNGWAYTTSSTQGSGVVGCWFEDNQAIGAAGANLLASGCIFTGGDDTDGAAYLSVTHGGQISAVQCLFAPANTLGSAKRFVVETGNFGVAVLRECKFESNADEMLFDVRGGTVELVNCFGSSMPAIEAASFPGITGQVRKLTQLEGCEVADLPDPTDPSFLNLRGWVTDANATTYRTVVVGGGSNVVPVLCDGDDWVIA